MVEVEKPEPRSYRLIAYIEPSLADRVKAAARGQNVSISDIVRTALLYSLDK